jgi:hypothetical protein
MNEAQRLINLMAEKRRTMKHLYFAVVWAPRRGRWPARFSVLARREIERVGYMVEEPWRLVGVYHFEVDPAWLADDLDAFFPDEINEG